MRVIARLTRSVRLPVASCCLLLSLACSGSFAQYPPPSGSWTYNSNNQLTSAPAQNGLAGASGLSYDASGNLITANGMTLSYDAWGHLSSVAGTPNGTVTLTYDYAGRRVSKTVGGATTYYLYDGEMLICEIDGATGNVTRSYNWGATGLIGDRVNGVNRYYLYDAQNNTREILDASGAILSRGAYTAWGSPIGGLSPSTPMGWKGRIGVYLDSETGLIYMLARHYAPNVGRFVSRDPLGMSADINVYGYCGGDPINFVDALWLEYTILGLRRGTWFGIGAGLGVLLLTGNPALAVGVGCGIRGFLNSGEDGNSLGRAAFDGVGHFCAGYVGTTLGAEILSGAQGYLLWRAAGAGTAGVLATRIGSNPAAVSTGANTATGCGGGTPALVLGRNLGSTAQWNMQRHLLQSGVRPSGISTIGNPKEMESFFKNAGSIHFNLADTNPKFLSDVSKFTAQEWQFLTANSVYWPMSTVYNVPPGVTVPPGIFIGASFGRF